MSDANTPERSSIELRLGLGPGAIVEGRYEIIRLLGEGGMGAVFEARHRTIGRSVAIKILKPELTMNEQYTGRFLQEARSAAELHHRHIVEIMDYGVSDGKPYMVMEYLRGESMSAYLSRKGLLSASEAVEIMDPVLRALAVAHERGIVHRDIKPENIFLVHEEDGVVPKVVDFGIAKHHRADEVKLTTDQMALGTPAYMAPEQIMSSKTVTAAADQYAVGVTFYEALTGENPYDADTLNAFIVAKATQDPFPLSTRRPDLDAGFAALIMKTLQRKPEDRFVNILALRESLLPFRTGATGLHVLTSPLSAETVKSAPTNGIARPLDAQIPVAPQVGSPTMPGPMNAASPGAQTDGWSIGTSAPSIDPSGATMMSERPQATPTVMSVPMPPPSPPSSHKGLMAGVGLVLVALAGVGVWRITQTPATTTQIAQTPPAPPPPPPTNNTVMFDIRVEPSTAQIFIDGEAIGTGHSAVTRPHDGRHYQLELRAAGHTPVHEVLTADADTRIERHLTPETPVATNEPTTPHGHAHGHVVPPTVATPPTTPPATPPATPTEPERPHGNHPQIDRNNPFGH